MKKILALALVAVMMMALVGSAMAADTTLAVNAVDGHTYKYFQLFVGDLADDGHTLSNVKWGSNVASSITYKAKANESATDFTVDTTINPVAGQAVPQAVLDYLASLSGKTATDPAQATADIISAWVTGNGTEITSSGVTVPTGYYVIKDSYTDSTVAHNTTLSTNVVEILGPTTITPKSSTITHEKEVLDINDTTDVALDLSALQNIDTGWAASADYDFGDAVPFKLTTTIADDFGKYTAYYLKVSDTMCNGLTLNADSIKVYVNGTIAKKATSDTPAADEYKLTTDAHSFSVEFAHLNGINSIAAGGKVVVVYTATLNADGTNVVIGGAGNTNSSTAEFSNNPNGDQTGTGTTPPAIAVVFTYKTIVNKIDKDTNPLVGAEFTLTKKLQNGSTVNIAVIKYDEDGNVTTKTANGTATSEGDATQFSFNGLDDGVYVLTETVTPNGYNTINPVTFRIVAVHDANGITSLEVKNEDGSDWNGELSFSTTASTGTVETNVVNNSGTVLPSTGGVGTTIFYVAGLVLVLGAAVILVVRRKADAE